MNLPSTKELESAIKLKNTTNQSPKNNKRLVSCIRRNNSLPECMIFQNKTTQMNNDMVCYTFNKYTRLRTAGL
jgi:hypothetical protein